MTRSLRTVLRYTSIAAVFTAFQCGLVFAADGGADTRGNATTAALLIQAQAKMFEAQGVLVRASSDALLRQAEAAVKWQEVRAKQLENEQKYAENYYARKRTRREYQEETRRQRMTRERAVKLACQDKPPRLRELMASMHGYHVEPNDGQTELIWPDALQDPAFESLRSRAQQLWQRHCDQHAGTTNHNAQELVAVSGEMQALLAHRIAEMTPSQYVSSRRFLRSLAYEAEFPVEGSRGLLASNK